jgi:hypothetical protein
MASYHVGQVVFVVASAKMAVYPLVIAEEVTRKTLTGEETTYLVKKNHADDSFDLSRVAGEIYAAIDDVKAALISNVTHAIGKICDKAEKKSVELAPPHPTPKKDPALRKSDRIEAPTDDQIKSFILEDGTKARVILGDI